MAVKQQSFQGWNQGWDWNHKFQALYVLGTLRCGEPAARKQTQMDGLTSGGKGTCHFKQVDKGGLAENVTFEVTPERGKGTHYRDVREEAPARGRQHNSKCKDPEVGRAHLVSKDWQGGLCVYSSDDTERAGGGKVRSNERRRGAGTLKEAVKPTQC